MERIEQDDTQDDLHKKIVKDIKDAWLHFSDWRTQAKEDYEFYAGEQWSLDDKSKLDEEGRPHVTFNRVARTVNAVSGLEIQNRQEIRYHGREVSDGGKSELFTSTVKWVREGCDAEDEESEAFTDLLICGQGWVETRLDYESDPDGELQIIEERVDPLEMGVDPTARKRNFTDARFRFRLKKMSREEYEKAFPGFEPPKGVIVADEQVEQPQDRDPRNPYNHESMDAGQPVEVQVAKYEYAENETVYVVVDTATGQPVEVPQERYEAIVALTGVEGVKKPRTKIYRVFVDSEKIISHEPAPCNVFSLECMTGLRDRNKNYWFGLVRLMKDPQRWANKWMSQIMHILNTQAKSGKVVYEEGAIANPAKFARDWADPAMPAKLNAGALANGKFQQLEASRYPEGIDRLLNYAVGAVTDTAGVNIEMLGLANRDQPGVLEETRKQAGITIISHFFNSLRLLRKRAGRVIARYISDYLPDGTLVRINGETGQEYVPYARDKSVLKYDIIVDDSPTSTNMKERTYQILVPILDTALKSGIPVPPDILDYTPLPDAMIQKWKQYIKGQQESPEAAESQQLVKEAQVAEIESKKSTAMLNMAKAQKEQRDVQTGADIALEQERAALEREKAVADFQLKRDMMLAEMQLKREQMVLDMDNRRMDMQMKHEVAREGQALKAQADSKPQVALQVGTEETGNKVAEMLTSGNQAIAEGMQALAQAMSQFAENQGKLAQVLSSPRKVIRDEKGSPIGLEVMTPEGSA